MTSSETDRKRAKDNNTIPTEPQPLSKRSACDPL
jgi:hypothetical protein